MARPAEAKMRVEREYGKPIKEVMQELYVNKNLHSSEITKMLGVTITAILSWCRQSGIPIKPKGGRIDFPKTLYPEMLNLYKNGMSSEEIARQFGCSDSTVTSAIRKLNGHIRNPRERVKRIYSVNELYFQNIDAPMKAYFLGWAASDGCVRKSSRDGFVFRLKLHVKDKEIIERFRSEIGSNANIDSEIMSNGNEAVLIRIHSAKFVEDLISHGVVQNKSKVMSAPAGLPYELEGHFIRGYFDGNGCITRSHKGMDFLKIEICGATPIIEWIAESIKNHTGLPKNKVCRREPYFSTLSYSCSKVAIVRDFMYPAGSEFGLKRKRDLLFTAMNEYPIVNYIKELMSNIVVWKGTATELYNSLAIVKINKTKMPGSPQILSKILRRHGFMLAEMNIITEYRKMPGGNRFITLKRL